jgi:hypothetical protein
MSMNRREMTGTPRMAAAISAGVLPAVVAFVVLMVVDGDVSASLVTALIVGIALSTVMWFRFGRSR